MRGTKGFLRIQKAEKSWLITAAAVFAVAIAIGWYLPINTRGGEIFSYLYLAALCLLSYVRSIANWFYVLLFRKEAGFPPSYPEAMKREGPWKNVVPGVVHAVMNLVRFKIMNLVMVSCCIWRLSETRPSIVVLAVSAAGLCAGILFAILIPWEWWIWRVRTLIVVVVLVFTLGTSVFRVMTPAFALNILHEFLLLELIVGLVKMYVRRKRSIRITGEEQG